MHLNIDEMHDPVGNASVDLHILKLSTISLGQDQWIRVWIVKSTEHNRFSFLGKHLSSFIHLHWQLVTSMKNVFELTIIICTFSYNYNLLYQSISPLKAID